MLSGAIGWLVELVREVDRGLAVGYGYEAPAKAARRGCAASVPAGTRVVGIEG